ncbi:hypothetical protein PTKIN_Ptkin01aG0367800 [Pterospermum kingtungense]
MMKRALANETEEKRVMAESLLATKLDATETEAQIGLLNTRKNELMSQLNNGINDLVRLRALETLLMFELGFL